MTRSRYSGGPTGQSIGDSISGSAVGSEYLFNFGQRPLKKPVVPTYVNNFESGWVSGGSDITDDTENYIAGSQALKFTRKAQAGTQAIELSAALAGDDWTGTHIYVRFYLYEGSGVSSYDQISTITMALIDTDGLTDQKVFNLYNRSSRARSGPGWHEAAFTIEESELTETGTFNAALVDRIRIQMNGVDDEDTPAVTFDQILVFPKPADTTVMVRLDDGFAAQYDMATYANGKGIPVTIGCIKEYVDAADAGTTSNLTTSDLRRLQDAGNLIVNHTINGSSPDMTVLSDAEFRQRIIEQMQWMCENGFTRGSRIFIVPQGRLLNSQVELLEELVDFVWWIEDDGRSTSADVGQGIAIDYDRFYCSVYEGEKVGRDVAAMNARLADAITAKGVYCPLWHADNTGTPNYEGHIDQIAIDFAAGNIVVATPDRYINRNE